jgi:hypothetical protein
MDHTDLFSHPVITEPVSPTDATAEPVGNPTFSDAANAQIPVARPHRDVDGVRS